MVLSCFGGFASGRCQDFNIALAHPVHPSTNTTRSLALEQDVAFGLASLSLCADVETMFSLTHGRKPIFDLPFLFSLLFRSFICVSGDQQAE
mmetsp:Transcript_70329/g.147234  ORF Transcript_70329/g.147234 Transcript_70329/m.147234 type:complete len:92 (-) Transcript_70329:111-386(-)